MEIAVPRPGGDLGKTFDPFENGSDPLILALEVPHRKVHRSNSGTGEPAA